MNTLLALILAVSVLIVLSRVTGQVFMYAYVKNTWPSTLLAWSMVAGTVMFAIWSGALVYRAF